MTYLASLLTFISKPTDEPTVPPPTSSPVPFPCYPDFTFGANTCLCDGNEPEYMKARPSEYLYPTCDECCEIKFPWVEMTCRAGCGEVECVDQYWADYSTGTCKKDCCPEDDASECQPVPPPIILFDSIDLCCSQGLLGVNTDYCVSRSDDTYTDKWVPDYRSETCRELCRLLVIMCCI